jgi:hypothetical protein
VLRKMGVVRNAEVAKGADCCIFGGFKSSGKSVKTSTFESVKIIIISPQRIFFRIFKILKMGIEH